MLGDDAGYGRTEGLTCYSQDLMRCSCSTCSAVEDGMKMERVYLPDHCLRPYRRYLHDCSSVVLRYPEGDLGLSRIGSKVYHSNTARLDKDSIQQYPRQLSIYVTVKSMCRKVRETSHTPIVASAAFTRWLRGLVLIQRTV